LIAGTKYLGGHSDLLCGVLAVKSDEEWVAVCLIFNVYFISF